MMVTPLSRRRVQQLARETVTLDHLSGGRLTLGVGLGGAGNVSRQLAEELGDDAAFDRLRGGMVDFEDGDLARAREPVWAAVVARAEHHELVEPAGERTLDGVVESPGPGDRRRSRPRPAPVDERGNQASDDRESYGGSLAENSAVMYLALKRANVPTELHIYATGDHDFGVRQNEKLPSSWTQLCIKWLRSQGLLTPVANP